MLVLLEKKGIGYIHVFQDVEGYTDAKAISPSTRGYQDEEIPALSDSSSVGTRQPAVGPDCTRKTQIEAGSKYSALSTASI